MNGDCSRWHLRDAILGEGTITYSGRPNLPNNLTFLIVMPSTHPQIVSLHRYFLWANRMRMHFKNSMELPEPLPPSKFQWRVWFNEIFGYCCFWFASLHVVVEGWIELGLHDPIVDRLIAVPGKRDLLRRFRNGVYHFQEDYFDTRFRDFMSDSNCDWASEVHKGLNDYFVEYFKSVGMEVNFVDEDGEITIKVSLPN